jgi:proteasome lid subunit RPN8/RPN11
VPPPAADAVIITRDVLKDIARHAVTEAPNECCGLLVGEDGRIDGSVRARNLRAWRWRRALAIVEWVRGRVGARALPVRYLIDPRDHFAALKLARARGLRVIGAYHSHPDSPPVPSRTDLAEAMDFSLVHVIVRPAAGAIPFEVRAWRLEDGQPCEVTVVPAD